MQALRSTMGKMERALGLIQEAIAWVNSSGEIEWCNSTFDQLLGVPRITLVGKRLSTVLELIEGGTPVPASRHPLDRVLQTQEPQRGNYELKSGASVELVAVPFDLPDGSVGAVLTVRDTSLRKELRQTRLQSLALQAAADAIVIMDGDGVIEWVNRAFTELTGFGPEDVYGKSMDFLHSGHTGEKAYLNMRKTISDGKVWTGVLINSKKNGIAYLEEQSVTPVLGPNGAASHFIAIKRDVTEKEIIQRELKQSEQALKSLYDITSSSLPYGARIRKVLELGCRRLGLSLGVLARITGDTYVVEQVFDPSNVIEAGTTLQLKDTYCSLTYTNEKPVAFADIKGTPLEKSGCYAKFGLNAYIGVSVYVDGEPFGTLCFADPAARDRDFSDGESAFIRLIAQWIGTAISTHESSEEIRKLSYVATHTDNAVIITDAQGHIEWVNSAFEKITEYELEEVAGRRPGEVLQGPDTDPKTVRLMSEALKRQEGFDVEIINYSKSGRQYWLETEVRPMRDSSGQVVNFLAIESDITDRKTAERNMELARQKEADTAARIQRTLLLGREKEQIPGVSAAALSIPSEFVDGDFFDIIVHSDSCMDVLVGDVMGKGVAAALLGAASKSAITRACNAMNTATPYKEPPSPGSVVGALHAATVKQLIEIESFLTLFYARLYGKERLLHYVDCGHTRSIHYQASKGTCSFLAGRNMPIGFSPREKYVEHEVPLDVGDIVVVYSDGITEAAPADQQEMFGEERLIEAVLKARDLPPDGILSVIHDSVTKFTGGFRLRDDLTCLVAKIDDDWEAPVIATKTSEYKANPESLSIIRADLQAFLSENYPAAPREYSDGIVLGVHEATTNIIQHGFGDGQSGFVKLIITAHADQVIIELKHNGSSFTAIHVSLPNTGASSGYGMYIMEQVMDSVRYVRNTDATSSVIMTRSFREAR